MKPRYKILSVVFSLFLIGLVGLTYVGASLDRGDWVGQHTVSGLQVDKEVVWELAKNKVSVVQLKSVLGEPIFEFVASKSKVLIYRSVTEFPGGTLPFFRMLGIDDDYTSIEEIWLIEVADDHVSAYERVKRVYYPVRAKDITFGLDNSAYGEHGYWVYNILPDS